LAYVQLYHLLNTGLLRERIPYNAS